MTATRLICLAPRPSDATSFYRAVGPLKRIERTSNGAVFCDFLNVDRGSQINWTHFENGDIFFAQRPFTEGHLKLINYAHIQGLPVWVDFDDDVFSVPHSNPAHETYSKELTQKIVAECLASADVVTVSTPALAKRYEKLNPNIHVIPNAYPANALGRYRKADRGVLWQRKLAVWRGSRTHDEDLLQFTQELGGVVANHLDWTYAFFGSPFWVTMDYLRRAAAKNPRSVLPCGMIETHEYLHSAWAMKPALFFVPLAPTVFNQSKSNIAWIEAAHAGAAAIVPDWQEWKQPGALNYANPKQFAELMEAATRGEIDLHAKAKESYDFIVENLELDRINQFRLEVIEWCLSTKPREPMLEQME